MKKLLLILLITVGIFILAACSQVKNKISTEEQIDADEQIKVEFWYGNGGDVGEIIESQVDKFNSFQDDIKVAAVFQESYDSITEKLQASVVGGNMPDVVQLNSRNWHMFSESDVLLDLHSLIDKDSEFDLSDYHEGLLKDTRLNGAQYTLPFNRSTPIIYYNKDMIEDIGFDKAEPLETWGDVVTVSEAIKEKSNGDKYGFTALLEAWYFYSLAWSNGGQIVSGDGQVVFDTIESAEGLQLWADMIEGGLMLPPTTTGNNAGQLLSEHFYDENVGILMTTSGALPFIEQNTEFELGTAMLPAFEQHAAPTGGGNLAIISQIEEEKQRAAWEFLKFMTNTEQVIEFSTKTGYLPYKNSAVNSPKMQQFYNKNPNALTGYEQLDYVYQSPVGFKNIEAEIENAMEKTVMGGGVSALEALKSAAYHVSGN